MKSREAPLLFILTLGNGHFAYFNRKYKLFNGQWAKSAQNYLMQSKLSSCICIVHFIKFIFSILFFHSKSKFPLPQHVTQLSVNIKQKSRIRETPTLLTDEDSRTDTIFERLRDLPIRTEKRTLSTRKCGLGSLRSTSPFLGLYSRSRSRLRSNSGTHPRFQGSTQDRDRDQTPEHILVFRALLKIEIVIEIELRNTSSFLGLYSRSRSRSNSGTHPRFRALFEIEIEIEIELRNTSSFLGHYLRSRSRSRSHQSTDKARSAPVGPSKKIALEGDKQKNRKTDTQTHRHCDYQTNSAQRAELVKITILTTCDKTVSIASIINTCKDYKIKFKTTKTDVIFQQKKYLTYLEVLLPS